jgi:hypothetical protein
VFIRRPLGSFAVAVVGLSLGLGLSATAAAEATHNSAYSYSQTFGSTLRLLKVDLNLRVTEVNPDWGYLLFEYTTRESGQRKNRGSFEFVKHSEQLRVTLKLPQLPSYHELVLLTKLERKLAREHGTPPEKPDNAASKKRDQSGGPEQTTSHANDAAG